MQVVYSEIALFVCLSFLSFKNIMAVLLSTDLTNENKIKYFSVLVIMTLKICQRRSEWPEMTLLLEIENLHTFWLFCQ